MISLFLAWKLCLTNTGGTNKFLSANIQHICITVMPHECHGVSNNCQLEFLFNSMLSSKQQGIPQRSPLRVFCEDNQAVKSVFLSQNASNMGSVSMSWCHKYSLLIHHIKIKSPASFLWNEQHVFVCWFITFQSVLLWRYYNDKKAYRILAVLLFKMSAAWLPWDSPWSLASTPWVMSLYFKFRAIYFWLLNEY